MNALSRERFELHPSGMAKAKYERLKSFVLAELNSGRLKPGDTLPSEPKLADSLQVARNTIRQALGELEQEGVIERVKGQGTFVREIPKQVTLSGFDAFAIIVPETLGGTFYSPLMSGFENACNSVHSEMIVRSTGNSPSRQADAILALLDKKIAGIAIVPATDSPTPPYQIRQLQQQGMPVVFCHRGVEGVNAPLLAINFKQIGRIVVEQFLERGHKKIAFLSLSPGTDQASNDYRRGIRETLHENGLELRKEFDYAPSGKSIELPVFKHEKAIRAWLKEVFLCKDRPTALFVPFDPLAEMVMAFLEEIEIRVPEEVSLLSFGPKYRETYIARRLSAAVVDSIQIGQKAVELLHEMRNGLRPLDDAGRFEVPVLFSEGRTLGVVDKNAIFS